LSEKLNCCQKFLLNKKLIPIKTAAEMLIAIQKLNIPPVKGENIKNQSAAAIKIPKIRRFIDLDFKISRFKDLKIIIYQ